jgi:hypothetical protein
MCQITEIRILEDCFTPSQSREIRLNCEMSVELMKHIAEGAKLDYFPDFPRPYFRIEINNKYVIQGIIGGSSFRVVFSKGASEEAMTELRSIFQKGARNG